METSSYASNPEMDEEMKRAEEIKTDQKQMWGFFLYGRDFPNLVLPDIPRAVVRSEQSIYDNGFMICTVPTIDLPSQDLFRQIGVVRYLKLIGYRYPGLVAQLKEDPAVQRWIMEQEATGETYTSLFKIKVFATILRPFMNSDNLPLPDPISKFSLPGLPNITFWNELASGRGYLPFPDYTQNCPSLVIVDREIERPNNVLPKELDLNPDQWRRVRPDALLMALLRGSQLLVDESFENVIYADGSPCVLGPNGILTDTPRMADGLPGITSIKTRTVFIPNFSHEDDSF